MSKPQLTVRRLLGSGFKCVGSWQLSDERSLTHSIDLQPVSGVYAFAIDGVVQYVGVASKSLQQRLNMYRKPGATQTTNIRLNGIIAGQIGAGAIVEILISHPPDLEWKGLRISGPEGLEAGLIREFDLPWNVRGAAHVEFVRKRGSVASVGDQILDVVRRRPGLTELEIAKILYGRDAVQQQVNVDCRALIELGAVERRGEGGRIDPYTYFPANNPPAPIVRLRMRKLISAKR